MLNFLVALAISTSAPTPTNHPDPVLTKANTLLSNRKPIEACIAIAKDLTLNPEFCTGQTLETERLGGLALNEESVHKLHRLGIALRQIGEMDSARTILEFLLKNTEGILNEEIKLSLANLEDLLYQNNLAQFKESDNGSMQTQVLKKTVESLQRTLSQYQDLANSNDLDIQLKSRINLLLLISKIDDKLPELKSIKQQYFKYRLEQYGLDNINEIKRLIIRSNSKNTIESNIKLLIALVNLSDSKSFYVSAAKQASETLNLARIKGSERDLSNVLGLTGQLLNRNGDWNEAQSKFREAANIASAYRASDLAYQWDWELGKIAVRQGDRELALQSYKSAVYHLEQVRRNLLPFQSNLQFTFLDRIEPIYTEYLTLLFDSTNPDLRSIIQINEKLRLSELENYLQCSLELNLTSILDLNQNLSPDAAIYVIKLTDKYKIIAKLKNGNLIQHSANKNILDNTIKTIKVDLQDNQLQNFSDFEFKKKFSVLYNQIISPIKNKLSSTGTILFSVDSNMQNIPLGLLYDGNQYFLEKYSTALTLGSKVNVPRLKSSKKNHIKPFFAGLTSSPSLNFLDLPYAKEEITRIEKLFPNSKHILDSEFTSQNLFNKSLDSTIIHIASHAYLSSNSRNTYLLNWGGQLKLGDLQQLVRTRRSPIELLVLSACETASGDRRAGLGLAGATVQSGALASIGTLWRVDDMSQATLMEEFFTRLKGGKSKAEALRLAQLRLLKENWSVFHWGAPILIGNYL